MLAWLYLNHRSKFVWRKKNKQKLLSKFCNLRIKKKFTVLLNSCKRFLSVQSFSIHLPKNLQHCNWQLQKEQPKPIKRNWITCWTNPTFIVLNISHFYLVKMPFCNANRTHLPSSLNLLESNKYEKMWRQCETGKNQRKIKWNCIFCVYKVWVEEKKIICHFYDI